MQAVESGHAGTTASWWYPILSVVVGFALSQITELVKSQLTRSRAKKEREIVFQRGVLVELQESLIVLVRAAGALHLEDVAMNRKAGEKPTQPYNIVLLEQLQASTVKMMALKSRVASPELRATLDRLQSEMDDSEEYGAATEGLIGFISSTDTFSGLNEELGRMLREMI